MSTFSIILNAEDFVRQPEDIIKSINSQSVDFDSIELIFFDLNIKSNLESISINYQQKIPCKIKTCHCPGSDISEAYALSLSAASMRWIFFWDGYLILHDKLFKHVSKFLQEEVDRSILFVVPNSSNNEESSLFADRKNDRYILVREIDMDLQHCYLVLFLRRQLINIDFSQLASVRTGFMVSTLAAYYMLQNIEGMAGVIEDSYINEDHLIEARSPGAADWSLESIYNSALVQGCLQPLLEAQKQGARPCWLQRTVIAELQLYFATDMGERSPTVVVTEIMAEEFHDLVSRIVKLIDTEYITGLAKNQLSSEVVYALLSYKQPDFFSSVAVNAFDHDQGLIRLSYYLNAVKPSETFLLDEEPVSPAYAKYRACRFFRRCLMLERIVWLPVAQGAALSVHLDNKQTFISHSSKHILPDSNSPQTGRSFPLENLSSVFPQGKGGQQPLPRGLKGMKVRLLLLLACFRPVRWYFAGSWVFCDRVTDADDNAEHLYRWVRRNHSEIKAWFMLSRKSPDWKRLKAEGFRLISNSLIRKLIFLNSDYIVSSHVEYNTGGLDRKIYGSLMKWKFIFLSHGVKQNDISHMLNKLFLDLIIATTPDEYHATVSDGTPYIYTDREVVRTGLARHDRLLELSASNPVEISDMIFVMPTWRSSLDEIRSSFSDNHRNVQEAIKNTEYVQRWSALLNSKYLKDLAEDYGKKVAFMPHPNAEQYLEVFSLSAHVQVFTRKDIGMQELFCRSSIMITDYSSVAFEMAFLRRPVLYYHFDRDQFYGGDHNWREGYFVYEEHGFGPVANMQTELISELEKVLVNDAQPSPEYLKRMDHAFPDRDGQACKRTFESIIAIRQPYKSKV